MTILSKGFKSDNFESQQIFEASIQIFFNVNLSLNQPLLTFSLYVRQTWTNQLILTISL